MNTDKMWRGFPALALMAAVTACGFETASEPPEAAAAADTCESIRGEIIKQAKDNGFKLVQIYEPKTILNEPNKVSCSGRALVSDMSERTLYYRTYKDQEGTWLVEYNTEPLETTP